MHCAILILLALRDTDRSFSALRSVLNEELGDRSPARSSNDFNYEIDQLKRAGAIAISHEQVSLTDVGKDILAKSKTLQFIAKRLK